MNHRIVNIPGKRGDVREASGFAAVVGVGVNSSDVEGRPTCWSSHARAIFPSLLSGATSTALDNIFSKRARSKVGLHVLTIAADTELIFTVRMINRHSLSISL